ncbi:hypothetical protein [Terrihalobacillus insolitus]|uniref:hypothetical protein n=1 Tax=Terrihalobacillus insolitus TaxID=2950438 RepID=UPI002340FDB7|nr:hypothetical protein [Terrihalobacillus insolitus]MDC3412561.1 hypothetical protein [Terrihalobacillus insolitus]
MQITETFKNRLTEIMDSELPTELKDIRLAVLMTDMESVYQIPTISKKLREGFERKHPDVMELYREVSFARSI